MCPILCRYIPHVQFPPLGPLTPDTIILSSRHKPLPIKCHLPWESAIKQIQQKYIRSSSIFKAKASCFMHEVNLYSCLLHCRSWKTCLRSNILPVMPLKIGCMECKPASVLGRDAKGKLGTNCNGIGGRL